MRERPILFAGPMVRAILAGTKTQTRRVVKPWHGAELSSKPVPEDVAYLPDFTCYRSTCPYGQPGDRLWVRETWRHTASDLDEARRITEDIASGTAIDYRATYIAQCMCELGFSREDAQVADSFEAWRPSIHMPRWASRLTLEITGVRVERLQEISEADAAAEGVATWAPGALSPEGQTADPSDQFRWLWQSINGPNSWSENPWVWVVEFKRLDTPAA